MLKIMTPGPTQVRENVRLARSLETTNPDLDLEFYDYYKDTCLLIGELLHTKNEVYILDGEGILGLEATCASFTEPGDKVLVIDNGVYGKGFADFVTLYGGEPVLYSAEYTEDINISDLEQFLEKHHDFKYATIVHCDTPSGVLNDVGKICPLLHKYGILSVVDSVSGMFGEPLFIDESKIDIVCGGSQKALSAPPGLSFVTVSEAAMQAMENRKTPIASFYANILNFKNYYENKWFPYTMPISDIYGLRAALMNIKENKTFSDRHKSIGTATRKAVLDAGLELYLKTGYSNTVTVIKVPEGINAKDILETMKSNYNIMIAGSFDVMLGKVIRIGHMGENANIEDMAETLEALTKTLTDLGIELKENLREQFLKYLTGY
ncbi:MAG: Serine-pyruvate aminotransferase/archaeal aspartate aminotransferase [Lachnospiraceae bacterium]|jgi:aspartate aminotransferase-like enzyme|nr:Serine-pyruvate aminotransferase/archaeal aspartate aminotransferase [Lachnospiraceae bacterium]